MKCNQNIIDAVHAINSKELSYRKAAIKYNVPISSLHSWVKNPLKTNKLGRKAVLGTELETKLADYVKV